MEIYKRLPDDMQFEIEKYWIAEHKENNKENLYNIINYIHNNKLNKEFHNDIFDFHLSREDYENMNEVFLYDDVFVRMNTNDIQIDFCGQVVIPDFAPTYQYISNPTLHDIISVLIDMYKLIHDRLVDMDAIVSVLF